MLCKIKMAISFKSYKLREIFLREKIDEISNYSNPSSMKNILTEFCKYKGNIVIDNENYANFKIGKRTNLSVDDFSITNNNEVTKTTKTNFKWEVCDIFFKINSDIVFVKGNNVPSVRNIITKMLYDDENNIINPISIDLKTLENTIRDKAVFILSGAKYKDIEGSNISINAKTGISDPNNHYLLSGVSDVDKKHIDILINYDDKTMNTFVYGDSKLTLRNLAINHNKDYFKIFLECWGAIETYIQASN